MMTTFLYTLSGGMLALLTTARIDQISWKFLRLAGFLIFAAATLATVWFVREDGIQLVGVRAFVALSGALGMLGSLVVVMLAPFRANWLRAFRMACGVSAAASLTAACLGTIDAFEFSRGSPLTIILLLVNQLFGAFLLGSITVAWLLGHAYLTATKMPLAPLRFFSNMLSWAVAVRALFLLGSVGVAWALEDGAQPGILAALTNSWVVLLLRGGVGLVAVGVFAYMVSDCVRLRATQSATGILYFGSICAYVGELASHQLSIECRWPL